MLANLNLKTPTRNLHPLTFYISNEWTNRNWTKHTHNDRCKHYYYVNHRILLWLRIAMKPIALRGCQSRKLNLLLLFVIVNSTPHRLKRAALSYIFHSRFIRSLVHALPSSTNYLTWHTRNASHFETSVRKISMNNGPFSTGVYHWSFYCRCLFNGFTFTSNG